MNRNKAPEDVADGCVLFLKTSYQLTQAYRKSRRRIVEAIKDERRFKGPPAMDEARLLRSWGWTTRDDQIYNKVGDPEHYTYMSYMDVVEALQALQDGDAQS